MLTEPKILFCSQNKTSPVNVLFVGRHSLSDDLVGLLAENHYSWESIDIDDFENCIRTRSIWGVVVMDSSEIPQEKISKFQTLLEAIDRRDIALVMYNIPDEINIETIPMASRIDSMDLNELWARIDSGVKSYRRMYERLAAELHQSACSPVVNDDLRRQLEMAGHVQRNFLPTRLPNTNTLRWATVFRPAEWVSGDIYDIRRLDEQHIGFYLADAVGHSIPAALLTMFLKQATVMRQTFGNNYTIFQPQEVMRNLNLHMSEQELAGCLFATSFYAVLNTETLLLRYARAGHPYPILIRDNTMTQLQSRGGLLGVFPEAEFEQKAIQLQPGDKLFVYSDGGEPLIGHNRDDASFEFTLSFRKICRLDIEQMLSAYNQMADNHLFEPGQTDDVTAIGLEVR